MTIQEDARVFGQHFEVGWQLGLLVARSVHKRAQAGRPSKTEPVRNKVSCAQFAKLAGVSTRTVQLVYDTWQLAAEEHHCTPAEQLIPGMDDPRLSGIDLADQEHREMWRKFYRQVRERQPRTSGKRTHRGGSTSRGAKQPGGNAESESFSAPEDHPLYGLLIAINRLADELRRHSPSASVLEAAGKVASKQHRAALRRATGAL
ncbi:hypothetical protein [Mycolicibacterium tokaiense]|nr:hypothetical protein [Mycolicibacterium tokaiense]BBY86686.1 hypothetical protein MTOK_24680 [Mycolicibacterium tokaiense]